MSCSVDNCGRPAAHLGLCTGHYLRVRRHGDPQPEKPLRKVGWSPEAKFAAGRPNPLPPDDACWEWTGTTVVGYGVFSIGQSHIYAHRFAYELATGTKLGPDDQVRHSCDNRRCVNPAHLGVGTFYDNMQDAYDRARFRHSEQHWNAKLTAKDVRMIRDLAAAGIRHLTIAENYGICRSAVTNIVNRKAWRHVD